MVSYLIIIILIVTIRNILPTNFWDWFKVVDPTCWIRDFFNEFMSVGADLEVAPVAHPTLQILTPVVVTTTPKSNILEIFASILTFLLVSGSAYLAYQTYFFNLHLVDSMESFVGKIQAALNITRSRLDQIILPNIIPNLGELDFNVTQIGDKFIQLQDLATQTTNILLNINFERNQAILSTLFKLIENILTLQLPDNWTLLGQNNTIISDHLSNLLRSNPLKDKILSNFGSLNAQLDLLCLNNYGRFETSCNLLRSFGEQFYILSDFHIENSKIKNFFIQNPNGCADFNKEKIQYLLTELNRIKTLVV